MVGRKRGLTILRLPIIMVMSLCGRTVWFSFQLRPSCSNLQVCWQIGGGQSSVTGDAQDEWSLVPVRVSEGRRSVIFRDAPRGLSTMIANRSASSHRCRVCLSLLVDTAYNSISFCTYPQLPQSTYQSRSNEMHHPVMYTPGHRSDSTNKNLAWVYKKASCVIQCRDTMGIVTAER